MPEKFNEVLKQPPAQAPGLIVCGAAEKKLLKAVEQAFNEGWVRPALVGPEHLIRPTIDEYAPGLAAAEIVDAGGNENICEAACSMAEPGNCMIKGTVETSQLMRAVLHRKKDLMNGKVISHISLLEVPYYGKLFGLSDTSVIIRPSLEQKAEIIRLGAEMMRKLGCDRPKAAVLAAVEKVNPAMPETLDAAALEEMGKRGELGDCIVGGPVSFDLALDRVSADVKKYDGVIRGDADLMLAPDLCSGNLLGKCFNYTPGSLFAGLLLGVTIPVALTSRASSFENKLLSVKMAAFIAGK